MAKNVVRRTGELNVQDLKGTGRSIYIYQMGSETRFLGKWSSDSVVRP